MQSADVTKQFKDSILALKEEHKLLNYLDSRSWLPGLEKTRENLFRSLVMDKDIT